MLRRIVGFIALLALLAACGGDEAATTGYTVVSEGSIAPGASVPAPTGEVVLTLRGNIGTTNVEDRLDFDMATLEALGLIEYTVNDPFIQAPTTYRGVRMERLLEVAGVPEGATTIEAIALNEYVVEVPIAVVRRWPVMLATLRNGERMPVSDKGPLEIVFPYDSFDIDPIEHDPMWAWQLRTMEIR